MNKQPVPITSPNQNASISFCKKNMTHDAPTPATRRTTLATLGTKSDFWRPSTDTLPKRCPVNQTCLGSNGTDNDATYDQALADAQRLTPAS